MGTFDPIAQFPNPGLVVSKKKLIGDGPGHRGHSMNPSMDNSEKYDEPDLLNSKLEGCVFKRGERARITHQGRGDDRLPCG